MQNITSIPINYIQKEGPTSEPISISILCDYQDLPLKHPISFTLSMSRERLVFRTQSSGFSQPLKGTHIGNQHFSEGLWKSEVSEIFIFSDKDERYFEFHCSPKGLYWGRSFTNYRQPSEDIHTLEYNSNGQFFELSVPMETFNGNLLEDYHVQICGYILEQGIQKLFSTSSYRTSPPDFHRKGLNVPLIMV